MIEQRFTLPVDTINSTAKELFGIDYVFPYQRLVISNILEAAGVDGFFEEVEEGPLDSRPHQIVILPTGAGKSLCFMLPAAMLPGPTLVVFPLLSLIADQARRVTEAGMLPGVLKGGQSRQEREKVWREVTNGRIRILLTNPETALSSEVLEKLTAVEISHLVVDETHTASDWGDTFRPIYREIADIHKKANIPIVTAFTATASPHILDRIKQIVFPDSSPHVIAANPDRTNIRYRVIPSISKNHDLAMLTDRRRGGVERPAIVFCRSRTSAELTARSLRSRLTEENIYFYHAGLSKEEKATVEEWFFGSDDGILTATCAYGMGVDKSNIRTVIHRDLPSTVEAYLQESGRGGRDRDPADAVLLFGPEDWGYNAEGSEESTAVRYREMLTYASGGATCRRRYLLSLLSAEPEVCFGCDVCRGDVAVTPTGIEEIVSLVANYPRRFTVGGAARLLTGRSSYAYAGRFHGILARWEPGDVEEAITALVRIKVIGIPRRGPWKRKLAFTGDTVYRRSVQMRIAAVQKMPMRH